MLICNPNRGCFWHAIPRRLQVSIPSGDFQKPIIPALAGHPFFSNHCADGRRGIVNHRPRVQPMHHSVLPEKGGVVSQGQSLLSRQALTRQDRTAKRNPRLARAGTGGDAARSLIPVLASPRFRLANQCLSFSLLRWVSEVRVVSGWAGWPNGMVHLLVGWMVVGD